MTGTGQEDGTLPRAPFITALALGIGLTLAPAVFGMFTAAPLGGQMIDDFRPFMQPGELAAFKDHLSTIGAAADGVRGGILPRLEATGALAPGDLSASYPATATFLDEWPAIDSQMTAMLDDIAANVDNFAAVDALPPFGLFPWFFVVPGLVVAGLAATTLRAGQAAGRRASVALALVGVGLIGAPAVFGMFTRAPDGGRMIDDLRPIMTREQITAVQSHFVTLGAGEGELRNGLFPALEDAGTEPRQVAPDAAAFVEAWPTIAADMAPMVAAMSDNLDGFRAVDGLPPFALFPWFFVVPGVLLIGLAAAARLSPRRGALEDPIGAGGTGRPAIDTEGST